MDKEFSKLTADMVEQDEGKVQTETQIWGTMQEREKERKKRKKCKGRNIF